MHITRKTQRLALAALIYLGAVASLSAQADAKYKRTDEMIPMRDGVRLYTQIFTLHQPVEPLPFLFIRTPYGTGQLDSARLMASLPELAADGYIFVMQD